MPYGAIEDLPDQVKSSLSAADQEIFLGAFNSAYEGTCKDTDSPEKREECAFKIAWSAVEKTREDSSPDTLIEPGAAEKQEQPGITPHIRALAIPFAKSKIQQLDDGDLLIKDVPMLAEGEWTDSAVQTPLFYPSKTLEQFAGNWLDNSGWNRHGGGVPRRCTDKVAEAVNPHFGQFTDPEGNLRNGVLSDVRVYGATQNSRDMQEMIKRKLIKFVSVEHGGKEAFNRDTRRMEAESLAFQGFAFVNAGACKVCRFNEAQPVTVTEPNIETTPEVSAPEVDLMETKELEAKITELQTGYEARIKELESKIPVPDDTKVKALEARIKELENQPAAAVTAPAPIEQVKELGEVETYVYFDRKNKIARGG